MRSKTVFIQTIIIGTLVLILLSACNLTAKVSTSATATQAAPTEAMVTEAPPTVTAAPIETPVSTHEPGTFSVTVETSGVVEDVMSHVVAAVPASSESPWWQVMPQHTLLTLPGYSITDHVKEPQIFVYPVKDLGVNDAAVKTVESLQSLLQNQVVGEKMPFLPLSSDTQMTYAKVKYLDFKNGKGVRYLTQFANGIVPINNHELFYTYQGLTSDGQYFVAAVLPVNLNGLPVYPNDTENLPLEYSNDYSTYLANMVNQLNLEPDGVCVPDISKLDAMMQSIEVK